MRALNPFTGSFYREALQVSRMTREMFCLMEGRHVHPSTLYPGGVGTVPTIQLFTDYLVRLMKYVEFMKKVVPLHDDLFDFFYEALPGYEEVGQRRILLGVLGFVQQPGGLRLHLQEHDAVGPRHVRHPRRGGGWKAGDHDLVDINLNIRILLGSSYYDDWKKPETFVKTDPLGNPVDQSHPWNQTTIPQAAEARFRGQVHLGDVASVAGSSAPAIISLSIPVADRSRGSGRRRSRESWTSATSRRPATA